MLDQLNKYEENDHFFFQPTDNLAEVCNAPTDKAGVYVIHELARGKVRLIYIGMSGQKNKDGSIKIRKAGYGGMKDRIVNGHQFGKILRKKSWPIQMLKEDIEALDVYWYVTFSEEHHDFPRDVERELLELHMDIYGQLPKWNKEV
ncbi:MAG: hypothetical protein JKY52_20345 [Flavobacteriales bacterium]|nr:hypothetical protein [Flavobacteriales bacterium]